MPIRHPSEQLRTRSALQRRSIISSSVMMRLPEVPFSGMPGETIPPPEGDSPSIRERPCRCRHQVQAGAASGRAPARSIYATWPTEEDPAMKTLAIILLLMFVTSLQAQDLRKPTSAGSGAVTSVFTRTGDVVKASGDYNFSDIGSFIQSTQLVVQPGLIYDQSNG